MIPYFNIYPITPNYSRKFCACIILYAYITCSIICQHSKGNLL